jgi:hypothetical protein
VCNWLKGIFEVNIRRNEIEATLRTAAKAVALLSGVSLAALTGACSSVVPGPITGSYDPYRDYYHVRPPQDYHYEPLPAPVPPAVGPVADAQADAGDDDNGDAPPAPHAGHRLTAPGLGHDLTVAAGGYVAGRQAENLIRRLKRPSLAVAGETAATAGIGTVAGRAAASRAAASGMMVRGGAAAAAEGAVGEAAVAGEAAALGAEEVAGAGLAAGASEWIIPGLIVLGGAVLLYEAYQSYQHPQQETADHGR